LNANTLWYNTAVAFDMLIGRTLMIIPMLAIAGNLADKKYVPPSLELFPYLATVIPRSLRGIPISEGLPEHELQIHTPFTQFVIVRDLRKPID